MRHNKLKHIQCIRQSRSKGIQYISTYYRNSTSTFNRFEPFIIRFRLRLYHLLRRLGEVAHKLAGRALEVRQRGHDAVRHQDRVVRDLGAVFDDCKFTL